MSEISLTFVLLNKKRETDIMSAKVQIKSEKFTPFGGIFYVINYFQHSVARHVDDYLGPRCLLYGYQYSEALTAMTGNFITGGTRTEDINVLKGKLPQHPGFRLCSPDTVLRCLSELACPDTVYTSDKGKSYRFNTAESLNGLLVYVAVKSGQLRPGVEYDFDFDHEFLASETWDAQPTYKHFDGYGPGCAVATDPHTGQDVVVGIENRDGNTPVKFHQEDTLERILLNFLEQGMKIRCARVDCGSYTKDAVRLLLQHSQKIFVRAEMCRSLRERLQSPRRQWRKTVVGDLETEVLSLPFDGFDGEVLHCRLVVQRQKKGKGTQLDCFEEGGDDVYVYRAILTNEWDMTEEEVIDFYNQRGAKERVFDQMDNDFGWHYLPKGLLRENTVFMILTAIIRNFYKLLLRDARLRAFGIHVSSRMKAFVNKVVSVVARWTRGGRRDILTVYTDNAEAYKSLYASYG